MSLFGYQRFGICLMSKPSNVSVKEKNRETKLINMKCSNTFMAQAFRLSNQPRNTKRVIEASRRIKRGMRKNKKNKSLWKPLPGVGDIDPLIRTC